MPLDRPAKPEAEALILAAGVGRRLGDADERPKIMLTFGGASLLVRHLRALHGIGIRQVTIVVGYAADQVRSALAAPGATPPGLLVTAVENPDYREALRHGGPVILMDGDVLYDARLLGRLAESGAANCLLLDRDIEPGDEPVKLCIREGRIVDFRKRPTEPHDWYGESVGFFRFTAEAAAELADRAADYVSSGRRAQEYEEPIRDMIMASTPDRFGFEDITGLPWTEIDFPEDVVKANALLPELHQ
jgi:choline kinase